MTSIYGKRNIDRYVSKAESEGRLIYTKKEETTQGISQVQYEGNINADSSNGIVYDIEFVVKNQDRRNGGISNRTLPANALETAAQNDIERKRLAEYRDFHWKDIACLRYNPKTKEWTKSGTKGDTHDAVWETISESEANVIQSTYTPLCLEMKPLSQFPMNG